MSHTIQRSRTSTSPRGYYTMDQSLSHKRDRSIRIFTDISQTSSPTSSSSSLSLSRPYSAVTPYAPEPPSPNYHSHRHSGNYNRERRVIEANIVTRSPDHYPESPSHYSLDTQAELAHYYRGQLVSHREPQRQIEVARPARASSHRTKSLALQPAQKYELALVPVQYRDAIVVERAPYVKAKPVVVEKKQTVMIRDDRGRWCKVRTVVR